MQNSKPHPDLALAKQQHDAVQSVANDALCVCAAAVELARITASTIAKVDRKEFAKAPAEMRAWAKTYTKIAKLGLPEKLAEASPMVIREAIELLQIVP